MIRVKRHAFFGTVAFFGIVAFLILGYLALVALVFLVDYWDLILSLLTQPRTKSSIVAIIIIKRTLNSEKLLERERDVSLKFLKCNTTIVSFCLKNGTNSNSKVGDQREGESLSGSMAYIYIDIQLANI